jgi:hypothetical protein
MQNIIPPMIQQIETVTATAQANEAMKTGAPSAEMKRKWKPQQGEDVYNIHSPEGWTSSLLLIRRALF